jgi:CRP-like cAMP-binding protein
MSLETEVQSLREVPMFRGVEGPRLKLLAFASERVSYAAGQVLFEQGDAADSAYVILEGAASVVISTPGGKLKVAELGKNAIVGEMGIILDAPRSATIIASQDVVALKIRKDVFLDMIREFPQMSLAVMQELARRLERADAKLASLSLH